MILGKVLERFVRYTPVSVMTRGLLENVFAQESLDQLFAETAQRQYPEELLFSSVVDLLSPVVAGVRKSVHEAYQAEKEKFSVAVQSVYNKLHGVEPTSGPASPGMSMPGATPFVFSQGPVAGESAGESGAERANTDAAVEKLPDVSFRA